MKFDRPSKSKEHISLINSVTDAGFDPMALRNLLWLVNAHPKLTSHFQVFDNIGALLNSEIFFESNLGWASTWIEQIKVWIDICQWIKINQLKLSKLPHLHDFNLHKLNKHPLVGCGVDRHSVVTSLWSRHQTCPVYPPTLNTDPAGICYFLLQGHLLSSYIESRFRHSSLCFYEEYDLLKECPVAPTSTYFIGLAIRDLSSSKFNWLNGRLPMVFATDIYASAILQLPNDFKGLDSNDLAIAKSRARAISHYFCSFNDVLKGRIPVSRKRIGSRGGHGGRRRAQGFIHPAGPVGIYLSSIFDHVQDFDEPKTPTQTLVANMDTEVDCQITDDALAAEVSGLAPMETYVELLTLYKPDELQGQLLKLRLQSLALEAHAQSMPSEYTQLTGQELFFINQVADNEIKVNVNATKVDMHTLSERTLASFLVRIMLVLGQSVSNAWSMRCRVYKIDEVPHPELVDGNITLLLSMGPEEDLSQAKVHGFCMPAIMPQYFSSLSENLEQISRDRADAFVVPDVLGLGQQIISYLCAVGQTELRGWGIREAVGVDMVRRFLNSFGDSRLTYQKVSHVLSGIIKNQTGDQSLAWVVTADIANAAQARMHYTRYQVERVEMTYRCAARRLARMIGYPFGVEGSSLTEKPPLVMVPATKTVGARFVIDCEAVRKLVEGLLNLLSSYQERLDEPSNRRKYHLYYLIYTLLYQQLVTGVRAVTQPDELYTAWMSAGRPLSSLVVSLSDKDFAYSQRARPVLISAGLAQHYSHFIVHRQNLERAMPELEAWITKRQKQLPFFVITQEFKIDPVTPTWMENILREMTEYGIPPNFSRAFLRTELLARKCPPEVIDAHLGHANVGESPFGKLSTFDYSLHFECLEKHLGDIQDELGLRPVVSALALNNAAAIAPC